MSWVLSHDQIMIIKPLANVSNGEVRRVERPSLKDEVVAERMAWRFAREPEPPGLISDR